LKIDKIIQDDRQAKLTVEYTSDEFEAFKRRAAKKVSKNAKIPGFRPGKAPYQVIVNHYGEETIIQEAIDLLIEVDYSKILEQAEIEPSGAGNLESLESFDPPKFILMIPLAPEIDLGDYREVRKPYELEEFNTSAVDDYIIDLRRRSATIVPANHPAEVGDLVYYTLSGEFLNPADDDDATITDKTPQEAIIQDEEHVSDNEWPYPGFTRELLGVKDGGEKEIQYTYPENFEDETFRGKTALFSIEVQSVKALELPEFDEDFLKLLGDFESEGDFREKLEQQLRAEHQANYDRDYINEILKEISDNAILNYPPQMLDHEIEHVLEDIKSRLTSQKMDYETYLKLRGMEEQAFIEEDIRPVAKQRLERSLIVDTLIELEGLKLDKDLVNEQTSNVVREIFSTGKAEELQREMGSEEFSRMITMEGVSRTMNILLNNRLKLIGTGQPIPEDDEAIDAEQEDDKEIEIDLSAQADKNELLSSDDEQSELTDTISVDFDSKTQSTPIIDEEPTVELENAPVSSGEDPQQNTGNEEKEV